MHFNNFLNKLQMNRIYALILIIVSVIVVLISLGISSLIKEDSPEEVLQTYKTDLADNNFNEATELIVQAEKENWSNYFYNISLKQSPKAALARKIMAQAQIEFIAKTDVSTQEQILKIQITAPDAPKIMAQISADMDSASIDVTDPEVVHLGESKENKVIYYALDNFDDFSNITTVTVLDVHFKKENAKIKDTWRIVPSDELHLALSGQLDLKDLEDKPATSKDE